MPTHDACRRTFITWLLVGAAAAIGVGLLVTRLTRPALPSGTAVVRPAGGQTWELRRPPALTHAAEPAARSSAYAPAHPARRDRPAKVPPRFVSPPPAVATITGTELLAQRPTLSTAWSQTAKRDRPAYGPDLIRCAATLKDRHPETIEDGRVVGAVAVTFKVVNGQATVESIAPQKGADADFATCFERAVTWAKSPMDVKGEKDGSVTVEWPFRLRFQDDGS